jgi:hypothetical protein
LAACEHCKKHGILRDAHDGPVFRRPDGQPYEHKDDGGGQFKTAFATTNSPSASGEDCEGVTF